ncbi:hypothetical protein PC9H_006461 [Pleurotus ostreatus]|uniref:DUF4246 domain-containing protein n=1 Tax=Pleurotus ostreatus TaxID=5322 RepID=A0A8H6ZWQ7_PLEOS|nr:uncharacterized protein PC9H_006461 [Pleurotus ostreatus]KAF7430750.1 hypothetical protein PC9H_006461 [Pleurotus ostreatus]KAJ8695096.1 hypothetical protein PTI98_007713 [Pleurotus ostreatus]
MVRPFSLLDDVNEDIAKFCDAIRQKPGWPFKLLDESKGLAVKWAMEAQLLDDEQGINDVKLPVVQALRDLKAEASRIVALDYASQLLQPSVRAVEGQREIPFGKIDRDVTNTVKFARRSKYSVTQPVELKEKLGVFVTDDLVPKSLHSELVHELDLIARTEPKDIHPGSGGKVQDLIHPSLYPYVGDISPVNPGVPLPPLKDGHFVTQQSALYNFTFSSRFSWIPSIFRISDDGTDVRIESYINGLGPRERYPHLYRVIEKVFLAVLPQLERTIEWKFEYEETASEKRWMERSEARQSTTREAWLALLESQAKDKKAEEETEAKRRAKFTEQQIRELEHASEFYSLDDSVAAVPEKYRGRDLKVIVKAANYVLQPGKEYTGTWHMEGMPHEQIVASAIYYYEADSSINDQGLSFRRRRAETDFPNTEDYRHENFEVHFREEGDKDEEEEEDYDRDYEQDYPSDWEHTDYNASGTPVPRYTTDLATFIELGTVRATGVSSRSSQPTGRIITFPNWIQHKVAGISHSSTDSSASPAVRKILCFFLVDENQSDRPGLDLVFYHGYVTRGLKDMNVLTSADVPWQARDCNIKTLHSLLTLSFKHRIGKEIPGELRNYIVQMATEGTISREEAEKRRRDLMEDRKIKPQNHQENRFWRDGGYSLCEH